MTDRWPCNGTKPCAPETCGICGPPPPTDEAKLLLLSTIKRTRRALSIVQDLRSIEAVFGPMFVDEPTSEQVAWLQTTYDTLSELAVQNGITVPEWPNRVRL